MHQSFAATPAELEHYGADLTIWQQIAVLRAWAPLISFAQLWAQEADPYRKALLLSQACEWLAAKTNTKVDDQLVKLLAEAIRTPQGEQLVRFLLLLVEALR